MPQVFKCVTRYRDTGSGLGWTLTSHTVAADQTACFTACDAWNDKYMAVCPAATEIVDLRVSNVLLWGDMVVFEASLFTTPAGTAGGFTVPVAECILLKGQTPTIGSEGRAEWHLHGFSSTKLSADGSLNTGDADVAALKVAAAGWLKQYRKTATPVHHLPVVDPPTPYFAYYTEGPYVRRLGNPFFLPGQRARYSRAPAP